MDEPLVDHEAILKGFTHKLNNLNAVIQGFSSLILMQDDLDPSIRENLNQIKEASVNSSKLCERTLLAGGCSEIELKSIDFNGFVPTLAKQLESAVEPFGVPLHFSASPELPAVTTDISRLEDILNEIVLNAAESAQERSGEITVSILRPEQVPNDNAKTHIHVFVRNTGTEINSETLPQVFYPFFTTKRNSHFGIGLTIAQTLARQMNMILQAQSDSNTITFCLSIPITK